MNIKKYVKLSEADVGALQDIDSKGVRPSKLTEFDFKDVVVVKPWGYEYLAFETKEKTICAWVLHMLCNGEGTSIHCHRNKKTLIHVLRGEIWVKTLNGDFTLSEGEAMFIDESTFHAMGALKDGTVLTEIESPSFKPDAIRWKDRWGRERQEYESKCKLTTKYKMYCPYATDYYKQIRIKQLVSFAYTTWKL